MAINNTIITSSTPLDRVAHDTLSILQSLDSDIEQIKTAQFREAVSHHVRDTILKAATASRTASNKTARPGGMDPNNMLAQNYGLAFSTLAARSNVTGMPPLPDGTDPAEWARQNPNPRRNLPPNYPEAKTLGLRLYQWVMGYARNGAQAQDVLGNVALKITKQYKGGKFEGTDWSAFNGYLALVVKNTGADAAKSYTRDKKRNAPMYDTTPGEGRAEIDFADPDAFNSPAFWEALGDRANTKDIKQVLMSLSAPARDYFMTKIKIEGETGKKPSDKMLMSSNSPLDWTQKQLQKGKEISPSLFSFYREQWQKEFRDAYVTMEP